MTSVRILVLSADENTLDRRIANQVCSLADAGYQVILWMIIPNTYVPEQVRSCVDVRMGQSLGRGSARSLATSFVRSRPMLLGLYHWFSSFRDTVGFWNRLVPVRELPAADLIVANDMPCLIPACSYAKQHSVPILFDAHEIYEAQTDAIYSKRLRDHWLSVARSHVVKAAAVITVNDLIAIELQRRYELPEKPQAVSNACLYVDRQTLEPKRLRQIGCLQQSTLLVCAGEVRPARRLDEFVRALPFLEDTDTGLVFLGHCNEEYAQRLRRLAASLGVSHRVSVGISVPSDELVSVLSGASLGLISNRGEGPNNRLGGPNRLFEYIQARLPILAYEHEGIEQVLSETNTGEVVSWHGPQELGACIERMLLAGATIAETTFEQAAKKYSWENEQQVLLKCVARSLEQQIQ